MSQCHLDDVFLSYLSMVVLAISLTPWHVGIYPSAVLVFEILLEYFLV